MSSQAVDGQVGQAPAPQDRAAENEGRIAVALGRFSPLLKRGLTEVLREDPGLQIIGTDLDSTALKRVAARAAHVAVVDEEAVIELSAPTPPEGRDPAISVVMLGRGASPVRLRQLVPGIVFVSEEASIAAIRGAVHLAVGVGSTSRKVKQGFQHAASLTGREKEVFALLMEGKTYAEIAEALHVTSATVGTHAGSVRDKLRVPNRWALLAQLEQLGMPIPSVVDAKAR